MTWKFHKESKDKEPNRDFTELNKMSLKDGKYKADVRILLLILSINIYNSKFPIIVKNMMLG